MPFSGIKSKPVYSPLQADIRGRYHLMVGLGPGGAALGRVIDELTREAPGHLVHTRVLYVPDGAQRVSDFEQRGLAGVRSYADASELLRALQPVLEDSLMGTRLYIAGPESFIGRVVQSALGFDMNKDEIRAEDSGSLARRVHCVHCRTTMEDVHTNIVRCLGCARWLLVRDHYSRRLAAYMGVMVDAEAPGEVPPLQEVFP